MLSDREIDDLIEKLNKAHDHTLKRLEQEYKDFIRKSPKMRRKKLERILGNG